MQTSFFLHTLKIWLPIAVAVTGIAALAYVLVQQDLRQGANDPQIQIVEDAAVKLAAGAKPATLIGAEKIEISESLTPFEIVTNEKGKIISSSATLDGAAPSIPKGVLTTAKEQGDNRVTWQPREGVRVALIAKYFGGATPGYVLAGRSLREVEVRENQMLTLATSAWAGTLLASLVTTIALVYIARISHSTK